MKKKIMKDLVNIEILANENNSDEIAEATRQLWLVVKDLTGKEAHRYPFKEGDTYYTVENGLLVCSCWDDTSEELYDADPEKVYYCVNKDGLIEWVPKSGGNKKLCSFPPELYLRRA